MNMKEYEDLKSEMEKAKSELLRFKKLDDQIEKKKITIVRWTSFIILPLRYLYLSILSFINHSCFNISYKHILQGQNCARRLTNISWIMPLFCYRTSYTKLTLKADAYPLILSASNYIFSITPLYLIIFYIESQILALDIIGPTS